MVNITGLAGGIKPAAKTPKRQRVRSVQVNRNLCNYPLARDPRIHQQWHREPNRWWCTLPGDKRIQFALPGTVEQQLRHCPTGFDVNVLMLLLGMAQDQGNLTITLPSSTAVLQVLGTTIRNRNRHRLKNTLRYWHALSIRFDCWYDADQKQQIEKTLPPPIQSLAKNGRRVQVTLQREWLALNNNGYFAPVLHLPLPHGAAAQNIVLALTARRDQILNGERMRRMRSFCGKVGLNHKTRTRQLRRALMGASDWFIDQHLFLAYRLEVPVIYFNLAELKNRALKKGERAKPARGFGPVRYRSSAVREQMQQARPPTMTVRPVREHREPLLRRSGSEPVTRVTGAQREPSEVNQPAPARIPKIRDGSRPDGSRVDLWRLPNGYVAELFEVPDKWLPLLER